MAFRGFDLLDFWRGRLTPRKLDVLIRGLPPDSATRRSVAGGKPLPTLTDVILADIFDATQQTTYAVANKGVPREAQSREPKPYPRPWVEPRTSKITAAALLAHRERTKRG